MQEDVQNSETSQNEEGMPKEAILELIASDEGDLQLRDIADKENPLVSIDFSPKIKEMLGGDVHLIGQQMIHSAIQMIMHKQMNSWHAHIYDEEPEHYS